MDVAYRRQNSIRTAILIIFNSDLDGRNSVCQKIHAEAFPGGIAVTPMYSGILHVSL